MKDRGQNNLWLQLIYCTSTSHTSYVFWKSTWGTWRLKPTRRW